MLTLQERGSTIRFCDDLRSHKQYYYAMQENSEDLIMLADDDVVSESFLQNIVRTYQSRIFSYKNAVLDMAPTAKIILGRGDTELGCDLMRGYRAEMREGCAIMPYGVARADAKFTATSRWNCCIMRCWTASILP